MYRGESVILRPFEREDLENYRSWVNNAEIARLIDRAVPIPRGEHERWYDALISNGTAVVFAIQTIADNCYVGNVWLWNIDWRHRKAELRVLIGEEAYQGKGLGREAIVMATDFAFDKLNLNRVYAYMLCSNERARKAFEKAGFTVEGVLRKDRFVDGEYQDVFLTAIVSQGGRLNGYRA